MSESKRPTTWFEVYSADPAKTTQFYGDVFGWGSESMDMGNGMIYPMLSSGGAPFGGIMDLGTFPEGQKPPAHWATYFYTPDRDGTVSKVESSGGKKIHAFEVEGVGNMAVVADCCGAVFYIHEPSSKDMGEHGPNPVNWIEQMGPNQGSAVDFYKGVFGWDSVSMPMPGGDAGEYVMFSNGADPFAGCMQTTEAPPNWAVYFHSDDLDASCEKVKAAGGQVMFGPMSIGEFGSIAMASDTTGAVFGIHQPPQM